MIIELFSIFFHNNLSLAQHEIFLLSEQSNFRLIKKKQRFLIKSFDARILAVRNCIESRVFSNLKCISSKEKFTLVSLLSHRKDLIKYYNVYVLKSKGTSFSFDFYIMYYVSFGYLLKFSILPFLETKLDKSFFISRSYKIKADLALTLTNILLNDYDKLWYLKFNIFDTLNFTNKLWLLRNFPLERNFLKCFFVQKNHFFYISFYFMIFNYLLTGLV